MIERHGEWRIRRLVVAATGVAFSALVAAALPGEGRAQDPEYDEYGRRPSEIDDFAVPKMEGEDDFEDLSLPDSVLDPKWPVPDPGDDERRLEAIAPDEADVDPFRENGPASGGIEESPDDAVPPLPIPLPAAPDGAEDEGNLPAIEEDALRSPTDEEPASPEWQQEGAPSDRNQGGEPSEAAPEDW